MSRGDSPRKADLALGGADRKARECAVSKRHDVEADTETTCRIVETELDDKGGWAILERLDSQHASWSDTHMLVATRLELVFKRADGRLCLVSFLVELAGLLDPVDLGSSWRTPLTSPGGGLLSALQTHLNSP
jgi:hypothetical protein